jgi:tripartite-type tricarboxylate transporter receptor subunit TctC
LSAVPALAKTVKIIVPFAAGDPVDQLTRSLKAKAALDLLRRCDEAG